MESYKLAICGPLGTGKMWLASRFMEGELHEMWPREGWRKVFAIDDEEVAVEMIAKVGYDESRLAMSMGHLRKAEGIILTYSIDDRVAFEQVEQMCNDICMITEQKPIVLCATKCDMEDYREVERNQGEALARDLKIPFCETSAMLEVNVDDVFYELVREIRTGKSTA